MSCSQADRELLTHHTDNQESTTEDRHEAVDPTTSERTAHDDDDDDDAWKEHPGIGKSTTVFLRHAGDLEAGAVHSVDPYIDNRVIFVVTIATCVCLVVITTVITAGIVICMKARRRHQPQMNPDLNAAFANLNGALLDLNISRDQARDIYEEIPDPPKAHRTSRVSSTDNSGSSVKNPLIEVKEREETTATQHPIKQVGSCGSFDGYLHPAGVSSALVDEKDLAPVGVLSP
ncbi:uncharacterized protein LOC112568463 [Pomacea canaliculata]|uniref:uncharacterized protein LOC112568463 n=1 Tax=Pomacea canaliculata TaxID=400727 RepID=UPI000D7395D0|nr:uncharacterized protein LOC112568463 [Pomacea canaliculata]